MPAVTKFAPLTRPVNVAAVPLTFAVAINLAVFVSPVVVNAPAVTVFTILASSPLNLPPLNNAEITVVVPLIVTDSKVPVKVAFAPLIRFCPFKSNVCVAI